MAKRQRRTVSYLVPVLWKLLLGKSNAQKAMKLLKQWISESGVEWTCKRLKALRTGAIQLRAGSRELAIEVWKENSIAYNRLTGYPKGIFGWVVQQYCDARRPSAVRRMDTVLRVYTSLYCKSLSKGQDAKAYKAITSAPVPSFDCDFVESLGRWLETLAHESLPSPYVRKPNMQHLKAGKSCHIPRKERKLLDGKSAECTIYAKTCMSMVTSTWLPEPLARINPCEELRSILMENGADTEFAGHIAFIQEGGCKARVVAVPNAWVQWLMEPLHRALDSLVQSLPESTVHDQNNGAYFMQSHLAKGEKLYCFDLSSATDRFPLTLQLGVLRGLGLGNYATAMEQISHAKWEYRNSHRDEVVSYKVGQPMGVYGSFPLFHLTHYLVLKTIVRQIASKTGRELESCFMVQGDDIIISDHDVADHYEKYMARLGVELSPTKTITSSRMGEYAGFVATTTNRSCFCSAYRPYKYVKPQGREPKLFNLCMSLGKKYRQLKARVFRKVDYDVFAGTLPLRNPDLSPLIPEDDDEGVTPQRLDSQLLGATLNRCFNLLDREMDIDRLTWWSYRRVLLGGIPLTEKEKRALADPDRYPLQYPDKVALGILRNPTSSGVSDLSVTPEMADEKDVLFGTHQQRDHLYNQEKADRSHRESVEATNLFGTLDS